MSNFRLGSWFLGGWSTWGGGQLRELVNWGAGQLGELANLGSWSTWGVGQLGSWPTGEAGHEKLDKPLTASSLTAHFCLTTGIVPHHPKTAQVITRR